MKGHRPGEAGPIHAKLAESCGAVAGSSAVTGSWTGCSPLGRGLGKAERKDSEGPGKGRPEGREAEQKEKNGAAGRRKRREEKQGKGERGRGKRSEFIFKNLLLYLKGRITEKERDFLLTGSFSKWLLVGYS